MEKKIFNFVVLSCRFHYVHSKKGQIQIFYPRNELNLEDQKSI